MYWNIFTDSGAKNPTDNFVLDFRNLYLDGKPVSSADQLDNNAKTKNNPMTFTNDGSYTPPKKNAQTVNWTAPDRVYAGSLQLIFKGEVKRDGAAWLLVVNAQDKADSAALTLSEDFARVAAEFGAAAEKTGPRTLRISLAPNEPALYRIN